MRDIIEQVKHMEIYFSFFFFSIKMNYGLGTRSKSQDAIRHRKNVRFANDTLGNSVEDLTSGGRKSSRGRSFFLRSMLQGDQSSSSSSNGRLRGSKVSFFFCLLVFSIKSHSHVQRTLSFKFDTIHEGRREVFRQLSTYLIIIFCCYQNFLTD